MNDQMSIILEEYYLLPPERRAAAATCLPDPYGTLCAKWAKRRFYTIDSSGKTDLFVRAWSELLIESRSKRLLFRDYAARKTLRRSKEDLGLDVMKLTDAYEEEILTLEWKDFAKVIRRITLENPAYGTGLLGMAPLTKDKLDRKFENEVYRVLVGLPGKYGMEAEFEPIRQVMLAEFGLSFNGESFADICEDTLEKTK